MSNHKLIQFLCDSRLVSYANAEEIASIFVEKDIPKNHYLLQEGKISNEYYFLNNGFMRSFAYDPEGNDVTTHFYSPNQVVFEVCSFFNRTTSKENIQATEDCSGCFVTYEQLNNLFHTLPEFREFGRSILVRYLGVMKTRMLSMITETAEQRYEALLTSKPEIFQYASLKHIASYLGITDTSLSRIRKDFSKKVG